MKVTIITGGVGGAKFLLGARKFFGTTVFPHSEDDSHAAWNNQLTNQVNAIVNVGDDAWMHGVRIAPDLDSCMYTLGAGIDPERGWGRAQETFNAQEELKAYKVEPSWFGLGDRDLATHLIRTNLLQSGFSLSEVTAALCKRWNPGVRLIPASDDRHETHVVVSLNPEDPTEKVAIHFQQWWVKERAQVPTHQFIQLDSQKSTPSPQVVESISTADIILIAPSNPIVSIGSILSVPGIRSALRQTSAPIIGFSPIIGDKALRGMAEKCLEVEGYGANAYEVARYYGNRDSGLLNAWIIDSSDSSQVSAIENDLGIPTCAIPLWMHDENHTATMIESAINFLESRV